MIQSAALCIAAVLIGCAGAAPRGAREIDFAIIGNTAPSSPFTGHPEKLDDVYRNINRDNPALVVHTGNLVEGGGKDSAVMEKDVVRQYRDFASRRDILGPVMHAAAGERDAYNGSLDLFREYVETKLCYSFSYGPVRFIILKILDGDDGLLPEEMKWLENDLRACRSAGAIFVFSHYPVMAPPRSGMRHVQGEELHALFARHGVKAAFSGRGRGFQEHERDGIRYVNAGCFGFNYEDPHWNFNQYYRVRYSGEALSVRGVKVKFPQGSYRPKTRTDEEGTP